ncbi:hypothetical protein CMUS01_15788, partial [Colletotrichum musicola]
HQHSRQGRKTLRAIRKSPLVVERRKLAWVAQTLDGAELSVSTSFVPPCLASIATPGPAVSDGKIRRRLRKAWQSLHPGSAEHYAVGSLKRAGRPGEIDGIEVLIHRLFLIASEKDVRAGWQLKFQLPRVRRLSQEGRNAQSQARSGRLNSNKRLRIGESTAQRAVRVERFFPRKRPRPEKWKLVISTRLLDIVQGHAVQRSGCGPKTPLPLHNAVRIGGCCRQAATQRGFRAL